MEVRKRGPPEGRGLARMELEQEPLTRHTHTHTPQDGAVDVLAY